MEIKTEVKVVTYKLEMGCDACGLGMMKFNGECAMTIPRSYAHRCTHCNVYSLFPTDYPSYIKEYQDA